MNRHALFFRPQKDDVLPKLTLESICVKLT
eukprot:UN10499